MEGTKRKPWTPKETSCTGVTGIKTSIPDDILIYHFHCRCSESRDKIEAAINELNIKIEQILDEDRKAARISERGGMEER